MFAVAVSVALICGVGHLARPQTKRQVEEVQVIGYRRLASEDMLKHIRTRAGEAFNEEQVRRDFQALLDLGQFDRLHSRVSVETGLRDGVVVIFEVHELPVIESVKFQGLPDGVTESEILRALAAERVNMGKGSGF